MSELVTRENCGLGLDNCTCVCSACGELVRTTASPRPPAPAGYGPLTLNSPPLLDDDVLPPPEPSLPAFAVTPAPAPAGPLVPPTLADLLANERGAKRQTADPLDDRPNLKLL